ncbi:MAG: LysM peptidoglycan-binding domain-containing protein [Tissierellales bacterium]|jgi:hypothetical protein|nr:LysM peptidoglycan-binding domain-containing protein [Tissierellales bacterium]MBN2828320.1 LysM peptidoglycan-binding domain-containing protein [Tissierellales bacterium]
MIILNRYRVYNEKRFKRFIFFSIAIIGLILATTLYSLTAYSFNETKYIEVPVRAGDTIWDIAIEYGTGHSVRQIVYNIIELNHIEDALIYPGQIIKIPVN